METTENKNKLSLSSYGFSVINWLMRYCNLQLPTDDKDPLTVDIESMGHWHRYGVSYRSRIYFTIKSK